jgi:hypothetical protein
MDLIPWTLVAVGVLIAVVGRRLFWLAVALAGFALGYVVSQYFASGLDEMVSLLIGIVFGIVFGIVAVRGLPLIASALGAVLLGLTSGTIVTLFTDTDWIAWVALLIGAGAGWLLVSQGLQLALVILTAACGGTIAGRGINTLQPDWADWIPIIVGLGVFALGLVVQFNRGDDKIEAGSEGQPAS